MKWFLRFNGDTLGFKNNKSTRDKSSQKRYKNYIILNKYASSLLIGGCKWNRNIHSEGLFLSKNLKEDSFFHPMLICTWSDWICRPNWMGFERNLISISWTALNEVGFGFKNSGEDWFPRMMHNYFSWVKMVFFILSAVMKSMCFSLFFERLLTRWRRNKSMF